MLVYHWWACLKSIRGYLFHSLTTICQVLENNNRKVIVLTDLAYIKLQNVPIALDLFKSILRQNINQVSEQKTDIFKCQCLKKINSDILLCRKLLEDMHHQNRTVNCERGKLRIWDISQIAQTCPGKSQQNHRVPWNILVIREDIGPFVRHHVNYQY